MAIVTNPLTGKSSRIVGFNPQTGQPIYEDISQEELLKFTAPAAIETEPSKLSDVKRIALSTVEGPARLVSDVVFRNFAKDKEAYDKSTQEKFKRFREGFVKNVMFDDTPEDVIDIDTGEIKPIETNFGRALDVGTYLVGGIGAYKALGKISNLSRTKRGLAASQITEQVLADKPDLQYNLANIFDEAPVLEYLAADKEDSVLLQRAKMSVISGAAELGIAKLLKLGFSKVDLESRSQQMFNKSVDDLADEQTDRLLIDSLQDARLAEKARKSPTVRQVERAATDTAEGTAQILEQSSKTFFGKNSWFKQRYFTTRGFLSREAYKAQEEAITLRRQLVSRATHIAKRLDGFMHKEVLATQDEAVISKVINALEDADLNKQKGLLLSPEEVVDVLKTRGLSADIAKEVVSARGLIDDLSQTILDHNIGTEVLRTSIAKNMGQYLRRSYRLFEDPKYVPTEDLKQDAINSLVNARLAKYKPENITNQIVENIEEKATKAVEDLLTRGEKDAFSDYISKVKKINKNFFKERKEIDPALRALMGEIESPTENIILTVSKLSDIVVTNKFYNRLAELGASTPSNPLKFNQSLEAARKELKDIDLSDLRDTFKIEIPEGEYVTLNSSGELGKLTKNKNGRYTVAVKNFDTGKLKNIKDLTSEDVSLVPRDNIVNKLAKKIYKERGGAYTQAKYIFKNKSNTFSSKIQGTNSVIDGQYTTPELARAINNMEDTHQFWGLMKDGLKNQETFRYFAAAKGTQQSMRTIYDHTTHLRNAIGGFQFGLANGINPLFNGKLNFQILTNEIQDGGVKAFNSLYERAQGLGVVNTSVRLGETRALLGMSEATDPAAFVRFLEDHAGKYKVTEAATKYGLKRPEQIYMATDDFFKLNAFSKELSILKKANQVNVRKGLPEQSLEVLEKRAAEIVKNTFPNYDRVAKGIRALREMPVGNFVAFPAEIIRTSGHIVRQGVREITSGNSELMKRGSARLAGFAGTNLGWTAVGAAGYNVLGFTAEENEALNTLNEGFTKNHNKQFARFGGDLFVHDPTYLNSYNVWQDLALNIHREFAEGKLDGEGLPKRMLDATISSFGVMIQPFADEAMFSELMGDLYTALKDDSGRTSSGKQLFVNKDMDSIVIGAVGHLAKGLAPGVLLDLKKYAEAIFETPNPTTGQKRSLEAKTLEMLSGVNFNKFTIEDKFNYQTKNYISTTRYQITKPKIAYGKEGRDFFAEYTRSQAEKYQAQQEMFRHVLAMRDLGFAKYEISKLLKASGIVGKKERYFLLRGKFLPDTISKTRKKAIVEKMGRTQAKEALKNIEAYSRQISRADLYPQEIEDFTQTKDIMKEVSLEEFEKMKRGRRGFAMGGEVDIPNASTEPDERIDKFTGLPYNIQAGTAFIDQEDPLRRLGFMGGGVVDPLARLGFGYGGRVKEFNGGKIVDAIKNIFIREAKASDSVIKSEPVLDKKFATKIIEKNKDVPFVNRMVDSNNPNYKKAIETEEGRETHRMANSGNFAYPTIFVNPKTNKLEKLTGKAAFERAIQTGEFIEFDNEKQAAWFATNNYKKAQQVQDYFKSKEPKKVSVETFGTGDIKPELKPEALNLPVETVKDRKLQIVKSLKKLAHNNKAIAALIGNVSVETGGTFSPFQVEDTTGKKSNTVGHGIFQLTTGKFGKKQYYDMWLKNKNVPDSLESQIQFMDDTIYGNPDDTTMYGKNLKGVLSIVGRKNAEKLRKVLEGNDLNEMTKTFSEIWERPKVPHLDRRLKEAQSFYNKYSPQ